MADTQGVPIVPSATVQGDSSATPQGVTASPSAGDVASIQQFAVEPSASPSATPQAQGGDQGVQQPTQTQQPSTEEAIRKAQSLADQRLAENLALQQQLQMLTLQQQQAFQQQQQQAQPVTRPQPDAQADPVGWWDWKLEQHSQKIAETVLKQNQQWLGGLMAQGQEAKFMQDHPDANVALVKQFGQARGIQNLEDSYTVLMAQQQRLGAFQQGVQQGVQQFRQPQGAVPLRTQPSTQTPVPQGPSQYSFEQTLREYVKNPDIEKSWPDGFKQAFWREANARGMQK